MWERPSLEALEESLSDPSNPIGMRMRAAYYLRQAHSEAKANSTISVQETVVRILANGLSDPTHGSLLRHEFAYIMGQLRDERSCNVLETVLLSEEDCTMVRHECAEALGAIGASRSMPVLETLCVVASGDDNVKVPAELSETCRLALDAMHWRTEQGGEMHLMPAVCACMLNPYSSVDPAPPHPAHNELSPIEIGNILCNDSLSMFERYRAMFSLRNIGGTEAVLQLCRALVEDTSSALLRHEVAYVLGQLQHPVSVEALELSLRRTNEHSMVRHESAEALGAIEGRWEDVERILTAFIYDQDAVIRESCIVALDAADYWGRSSTVPHLDHHSAEPKIDTCTNEIKFAKQKANQDGVMNHFNLLQQK